MASTSPLPSTSSAISPQVERKALIAKISSLQQQLNRLDLDTGRTGRGSSKSGVGPLPPQLAAAPKRHIALKFIYNGWSHIGLAYQPPSSVPEGLTTVEECILKALEISRLIEPMSEGEGFGCGFERCGRTDAGVSSSAQVINLWVRSDLKDPMGIGLGDTDATAAHDEAATMDGTTSDGESVVARGKRKAQSTVELPYVTILNKHLPSSIRILAWSPVSASFSSRYSCIWRHYKYFFSTSPIDPFLRPHFNPGTAYASSSSSERQEWQNNLENLGWEGMEIDVHLMRDAVQRLVGEHDFRNMCKIDPPKQLNSHVRTVISATIDPVEGEGPDMFVLNLRGGAFLYNQVRNIVALLFMVGAKLEPPSIIDSLVWTSDRTENTERMQPLASPDEVRPVVDCKPSFGMAEDLPLVLWECGYNGSEFDWRTDNVPRPGDPSFPTPDSSTPPPPAGDDGEVSGSDDEKRKSPAHQNVKKPLDPVTTYKNEFLELNKLWTQQRLKTIIIKHHLEALAIHAPPLPAPLPSSTSVTVAKKSRKAFWTPSGAGVFFKSTSYIPLLQRRRGELPSEVNRRWAEGRGKAKMEKRESNREKSDAARVINLAKKADAKRQQAAEEEAIVGPSN